MRSLLSQIILFASLTVAVLAQVPTKVAPEAYQLAFENEYVQVQRVHYAPRVKLPERDHTPMRITITARLLSAMAGLKKPPRNCCSR